MRDVGVPGYNLRSIDEALQLRFFQKKPDGTPAERWELKEVEVACPRDKIREHLRRCGFVDKTTPMEKQYDYAAWPGALMVRAVGRLQDLEDVWGQDVEWGKTIVFGGKRPLQANKEGFGQYVSLLNILPTEGLSLLWNEISPQTELDMMRFVWEGSIFFHNAVFVDAPMKPPLKEGGPPVRPTTEDTVNEWLKSNPKPGSVLLSSGAPYGMAMDEAFWMLLEPHGFTVETFGHPAPDLPIENFIREVAGCVNRIRRARLG